MVYSITGTSRDVYWVLIYIIEFKALHKLMLGYINIGLITIDLDNIMHKQLEEDVEH